MAKAKPFPVTLYVLRDSEDDEAFYTAYPAVDDINSDENGAPVAVYELREVKKFVTSQELI